MRNQKQLQEAIATATAVKVDSQGILEGIRFHRSADRELLRTRINIAKSCEHQDGYMTAFQAQQKRIDEAHDTIQALKRELFRSHERHASDLIEAHNGGVRYEQMATQGLVRKTDE